MLAFIGKFFQWMFSLWSALPESTKKKVTAAIVETCTDLFRNYYRSANKQIEEPAK